MEHDNSLEFWNEYFVSGWQKNEGEKQSEFFTLLALKYLPRSVMSIIKQKKYSITDIGCALADGTRLLKDLFTENPVKGIDFSSLAIEKAQMKFPDIMFEVGNVNELKKAADVSFCSNVLEHFPEPIDILKKILVKTKHMAIIMVPYEEEELSVDHVVRFGEQSFPERIGAFKKVYQKEIDARLLYTYWAGKQVLVIYSKKNIKDVSVAENYFIETTFDLLQVNKKLGNTLNEKIMGLENELEVTRKLTAQINELTALLNAKEQD